MPTRYLVLIISMLIVTVGQFSGYLYTPSLPAMVQAFHVNVAQVQLSLTLTLITYGFSQLIFGAVSDYYGRRNPVITGLIIFIVGSVITVFSCHIDTLLLGRMIQGIGLGSVGLTRVINRDVFHGPEYLKVSTYITMILALTPIMAPLLGGYIEYYFNWRADFVFLLAYALLVMLIAWLKLPETNLNRHSGPPNFHAIFSAYIEVLSNKRFIALMCCSMVAFSLESLYTIIAPFLLQNELGWTAIAYGWLGMFIVGGFLIGAMIASKLSHTIKPEGMLRIGAYTTFFASVLMLTLSWDLNTWVLVLPMSLYMVGMSMVTVPCSVMAMSMIKSRIGVAGAAYGSFIMMGTGLISSFGTQFHVHNQRPLALILTSMTLLLNLIYKIFINKPEVLPGT